MRFDVATTFCLLATNLATAFPATKNESSALATAKLPTVASKEIDVALEQLAELANFASENAKESLGADGKQKRGLCTPSKLSIRREWYGAHAPF